MTLKCLPHFSTACSHAWWYRRICARTGNTSRPATRFSPVTHGGLVVEKHLEHLRRDRSLYSGGSGRSVFLGCLAMLVSGTYSSEPVAACSPGWAIPAGIYSSWAVNWRKLRRRSVVSPFWTCFWYCAKLTFNLYSSDNLSTQNNAIYMTGPSLCHDPGCIGCGGRIAAGHNLD